MLKKMRRRFIIAAMAAFFAVVLILVCAVNIWDFCIIAKRQDKTLENIIDLEHQTSPPPQNGDFRMPGPFGGHSREARYMLRFFIVRCGADGAVTDTDQEHIASVSEDEAKRYAGYVLKKGRTSGFCGVYRYLVKETNDGKIIAFLNSEREIQSMKTLALVSGIIAVFSLAAVFLLVLLFSRRAISPYLRNMEAQKQFITDAGHELKTPLTSIAANADILAMEYANNEWVKNIQTQSARMSKLTASLVKLSRLDEEQPPDEKTEFSLSDAIWEISEPISALAAAKGKAYSQEIEDGITFCGDRGAVQQMVSAILDNAVKYSDDGGSIRLEVRRRRKKIEIEVCNTCSDSGSIDTVRIFDRFYRSDRSRADDGGFGIGLSAAKAVAERYRGSIKAEKPTNTSILFKVTL